MVWIRPHQLSYSPTAPRSCWGFVNNQGDPDHYNYGWIFTPPHHYILFQMGSCTTSGIRETQREFKGDSEPDDTPTLRNLPLPDRTFLIKISNIKLKNLPYDQVSLAIEVANLPEIKLQKKKVEDGIVRWYDRPQRLQLKMNEYQLRREWVMVSLFYLDIKMSEIRLNLFRIASGPAHLTFPMALTSKVEPRLSMDVHFSELVNVLVDVVSAEVDLDKHRPEEDFNFTFRTITRSEKDEEETTSSYPQKTLASYHEEKTRVSGAEDYENKIVWTRKENKPWPRMERKVGSIIQFMLWECHEVHSQEDDVLTGECYISLTKGSNIDPTEGERGGRPTFIYRVLVNQRLWLSGICIGRVKLELRLEVDQYIKQNLMYVRTQHGNQLTTPIFDTTKQRVECPEIIELQKLSKLIQEGVAKMHTFKRSDTFRIQDWKVKVLGYMSRLITILESSKKESLRFYIYKSEKDLLNGQESLLDIGFRMLSRLEEDESLSMKELCWKALIVLIQRGELSLRYTGFTSQEKEAIDNNSLNKRLKEKVDFSIKYQEFLYNVLKCVLNSMQSKNLQAVERKFVEYFCAFCYLRVPEFRHELLHAIAKPTDNPIEEWRGTEFALESDADLQIKFNSDQELSTLYDWENNFYKVIERDPRSKPNYIYLMETLEMSEWKERMEKRGVAFFLFLVYWVEYIQIAAIISINVKWYFLPGYVRLVKAVLCEMQRRNINEYPDSLKEVTTKMLANEKLLNVFVAMILKKINLMEYSCVLSGLDLISGYFKFLAETNRKIPTTFNYLNFIDSLKAIINHEHSFSAAVCLKLIYDHYNMFAAQFKRQLSIFLLGKAFFRLFLSWSFNIRVVFHHLLLFRLVLQSNRIPLERRAMEHGTNDEIKRRYFLLMNILENIKLRREEEQCDNFRVNFEKEYYKKMRKKIQESRRINATQHNLINTTAKRKYVKKENKYSIKELSRPTETLRAHSEILQNVHINYAPKVNEETCSYTHDYSEELSHSGTDRTRIRKRFQVQNEVPQVPIDLLEYTKEALGEFGAIEEKFDKFYNGKVDYNHVPVLTIKVPTDEGEFRMLEIEDW